MLAGSRPGRGINYWSLSYTEQKTAGNKTAIVLDKSSARRNNSPDSHPSAHVHRRADFGDEHIAWNLHQNVTNEKDGYSRIELTRLRIHPKFFLEAIQTCLGDCISY